MSRLFESTLTGKISKALLESSDIESKKESEGFVNKINEIADFMIDFDPYGFADSYDGDEDEKRDKLIQDITRDRKTVASYLNDIVVEGLGTEEQQDEAKRLLGAADLEKCLKEDEAPTPEELEAEDKKNIKHNKKEIEDKIGELRQAIIDGVPYGDEVEMEKEISELEYHLNESVDDTDEDADEFISLLAKSTGLSPDQVASAVGVLTKYVDDLTDRSFIRDIVDDLKTRLYDNEYAFGDEKQDERIKRNGIKPVKKNSNINEAYKADDGNSPQYRFSDEDAEYFRNLLGPGYKVEIKNTSASGATNGTMDISLDSKWVSGFMSSTRELDKAIDEYFEKQNKDIKVYRNNVGLTIWLDEKSSKKESNINESNNLKEGEDSKEALKKFTDGLTEAIKLQDLRNPEEMETFFKEAIEIIKNAAKDSGYMIESAFTSDEDSKMSRRLTEDSYEKGIFKDIEDALVDAGFNVDRYIDLGVLTKNIGWEVSNNNGNTQLDCPGSWYDEDNEEYDESASLKESDEKRYYALRDLQDCFDKLSNIDYGDQEGTERYGKLEPGIEEQNKINDEIKEVVQKFNITKKEFDEVLEPYISGIDISYEDYAYDPKHATEEDKAKLMSESVTVVTSDGSSVDTSNAASVQSNDGNVTVVTSDATVTINNNPVEPAIDLPQEEPVEEVPAEEIVPEEPIEEPIEDEVIEEADEGSDISIVSGLDISTVKNQGNIYMIMIKDIEGNEKYWVCKNYNASTNEADEAAEYDTKEDADKDYFERVGLAPVED